MSAKDGVVIVAGVAVVGLVGYGIYRLVKAAGSSGSPTNPFGLFGAQSGSPLFNALQGLGLPGDLFGGTLGFMNPFAAWQFLQNALSATRPAPPDSNMARFATGQATYEDVTMNTLAHGIQTFHVTTDVGGILRRYVDQGGSVDITPSNVIFVQAPSLPAVALPGSQTDSTAVVGGVSGVVVRPGL